MQWPLLAKKVHGTHKLARPLVRGLMQLMPATAKHTAQKQGINI